MSDYWLTRIAEEIRNLGLASKPEDVLALARVPGVSLDDSVPAVLNTLRHLAAEEKRYRWVWEPSLQRWGLMVGMEPFPAGLAFERDGAAYWVPFGEQVVGRQAAETLEAAKEALLSYVKAEGLT